MPEMDGVEATKNIRALGYALPIIALTANAVSGQAEMFMQNGFDGFISKPIDLHQLNAVLNKLVRDKHQGNEAGGAGQPGGPGGVGGSNRVGGRKFFVGNLPLIDPKLAELFIRDAEKAATALEAILANNYRRADDVQKHIINAHAMKSALLNIGEKDLSAAALKLEEAGKEQNIAILSRDTPAFLEALRAVIEKLRAI